MSDKDKTANLPPAPDSRKTVTIDAEEFEALQRRLVAVERQNVAAETAEVVRKTCNHCGKTITDDKPLCHPGEYVNHEGVLFDRERGGKRPTILKQTRAA